MFYFLWDYLSWRNWYYAVPDEVKQLEEPVVLYKETETQTEPNKVEITPVEMPVNVAELITQQDPPIRKSTRRK